MATTGTTKAVQVAILGAAGAIGRRHVEHVLACKEASLHSIVDPTDDGRRMAAKLGVPHATTVDELLALDPRPDAAIVATPSSMHVQLTCPLVASGVHVLVEKPLCNEASEADELLRISKAPGAGTILVGFHRRFNPYVIRLKATLDGRTTYGDAPLGTIVAVNALWCTRKPASYFAEAAWRTSQANGGGVILTNLSHELDLLSYLFGPIVRVYAQAGVTTRGHAVDETVAIVLTFGSGMLANILLSDASLSPYTFESATGENPMLSKQHQPVYTILGTKGTLNFPNMQHWSARQSVGEGDWTKPLNLDASQALPFDESMSDDAGVHAPFAVRLAHWCRVVRGEEVINCTLEEGIRNVRLLDAVLCSVHEGRPVNV